MLRTYQSRLALTPEGEALLGQYAAIYGRAERALFAELAAGASPGEIKPSFMARHGLTARQYNALAFSIKGKIRSLQEVQKGRISDLKERIEGLEARLLRLPRGSIKRHQKARRLGILMQRLASVVEDRKAGRIRMCFGSRKLFNAQFSLEANGYASHEDWLRAWRADRADEVFVLGSKDETAGCQGCQMTPLGQGRFALKLRLPRQMAETGKHLSVDVEFAYGADRLETALEGGQAISYRFIRDRKGWRVFASTNVAGGEAVHPEAGALGLDLNEDHLALAETDGDGNLVAIHRIDLVTYGCPTEQAKARIGDAVKQVIALARATRKPLVVESLDFSRKKREMRESGVRYARMLSSLSYSRILDFLKARGFDVGIRIIEVNPAFTSVIGRSKFSRRYGISVHGSAALVIARRALQFSERPNPSKGHGTSPAPVRKRGEHVWSFWGKVLRGERRMQRTTGRPKAIPLATSPARGDGVGGTLPVGPGGIPGHKSASSTVREASHGKTSVCYGF